MTVQFTVFGVAQQMGSKSAFVVAGRAIITDSNKALKPWQRTVRAGAQRAMVDLPIIKPPSGARLTVAFYLPRPKSLPRRFVVPVHAPDLDKLVRGLQDALTAIVFTDDVQVVDIVAMKRFALAGEPPHATVRVDETAAAGRLASTQSLFEMVC